MKTLLGWLVLAGMAAAPAPGLGDETTARRTLKVGVTAGPHAEIFEQVKKIAARDGLEIQIVEFNDYMTPNVALDQGDLDANSYQHQPWLDQQVKDRHYSIVSIGATVIFPMGIYSKRVKHLTDLKDGATLAIPNDPTNGARALLILQREGLLELRPGAGIKAGVADISRNPRSLKIRELDAAQIPRSLEDVDAAAINTNYAMVAGLVPVRDAIAIESPKSPYANLIAVRSKDRDDPVFQKLLRAYRSPEVKQWIAEKYQGSVVPTW